MKNGQEIKKDKLKDGQILDLFYANELLIAKLYSEYANKTVLAEFWKELAEEEVRHAKIIKIANEEYLLSNYFLEYQPFLHEMITYVYTFVVNEYEQSSSKSKIDDLYSLEKALRIEQSIIESKCLEVFTYTPEQIARRFGI